MTLTEYQKELQHMRNDSFTDFEKRLINNEITCIKPYFEDHFPLQKNTSQNYGTTRTLYRQTN